MDWTTGAALIVALLAIIANNQLTLHRERRKKFNEVAVPIREALAFGHVPSGRDLERPDCHSAPLAPQGLSIRSCKY